MSYTLITAIAVAALLFGGISGFFIGRAGRKGDQAKLSDVENEFSDYREQVTEHFAKTANHFQSIGQQYRELYEHMASGSEALCATDDAKPSLPFGDAHRAALGLAGAEAVANSAEETSPAAEEVEVVAATDDQPPADYVVETEDSVDSEASASEANNTDSADNEPVPVEAEAETTVEENLKAAAEELTLEKKTLSEAAPEIISDAEASGNERTLH